MINRLGKMTAVLAAVATLALFTAVPSAAAQTATPPPQGLGALLGALLDGLRGGGQSQAGPAPTQSVPAPTAQVAPAQAFFAPPPQGAATPLAVEQHLSTLRYDVGPIDGDIDGITFHAIMAFQKVTGLNRTGELDDRTATAILATTGLPTPLYAGGGGNRVEIDLRRQVLFLYEGDQLTRILSVSTGTAETPTPTGTFRVYSKSVGWETSRLGQLYNSQYFYGGYAIHGLPGVPRLRPHPDERGRVVPRPRLHRHAGLHLPLTPDEPKARAHRWWTTQEIPCTVRHPR